MVSEFSQQNDRHQLIGHLLRVRLAFYVAAVMVAFGSVSLPMYGRASVVVLALTMGFVPFAARHYNSFAGVPTAAGIDLIASFALWTLVPWAGWLSLLVSLWAIGSVVRLSSVRTASRTAVAAVALETVKVGFIVAGLGTSGVSTQAADLWIVFARAAILGVAYLQFAAIRRYRYQVAAAAETGSDRYRRLMDTAPTAYLVEVDRKIVYANQSTLDLLARPLSELIGSRFVDVVSLESRERLTGVVRAASDRLGSGKSESIRIEVDGPEELWVDATCAMISHSGNPAVQIALSDRSGQRKAEKDLYKTELDFREFFERIPVALYRSLPDGRIAQSNNALRELFGAESEEEVSGINTRDMYVNAADRDHLEVLLEDSKFVVGFEARMYKVDGQIIWVRDTSRRIETDDGIAYEGAMIDITGTRAIEDELWSRAAQQEAAARIGQMALDADDIGSILGEITDLVSRVLGDEGVVLFHRRDDDEFDIVSSNIDFELGPEAVMTLADRAHMTAAPVVLRTDPEVRFAAPRLADKGVRSCVAVMIPGSDSEFGTLIVLSTGDRLFTSEDINFLLAIANVLAAAIGRSVAKERLEDLLKSKDAFVASVSHELRTPLTVVTGMAHELNEQWMNLSEQEMAEFTEMLVEQSRDMSDIIEDLLVAARSNIGNVTVRREHVSLGREIESVMAGFTDTGSTNIEVRTSEEQVIADPIRVRQILRNLVTNALRYGGNRVEIVMSSGPGTMAVEVIDNGEGILPEDHDRIFVAYERAHHTEGQPGSVGLGLTVSRTLAELMGGSLTYTFDGRSTFRLELPKVAVESAESGPVSRTSGDELARAVRSVSSGRIGVDVAAVE